MSDIRPLTKQEVFDQVWDYFVVQGHPQSIYYDTSGFGSCMYRSENSKCAIGIFIPDDEYSISLEGTGTDIILELCPTPNVLLATVQGPFLERLQEIHDRATQLSKRSGEVVLGIENGLEPGLRVFAKEQRLTIKEKIDV